MNLLLLIAIPLLTSIALLLTKSKSSVKWIALAGSVVQLALAFVLLMAFRNERAAGNESQMLFDLQCKWFPAWNINFHVGVDG
ncbi:MAG: NADH-quinone oxidoreductase subunit M, partial [Bacteroidota bacterium]